EVETVSLAGRIELGESHSLHLPLELVAGATQVRDISEHRQHGTGALGLATQWVGEHLEQQVCTFARIHEVELARAALEAAGHDGAREVRREQQVVDLDGAPPALGI